MNKDVIQKNISPRILTNEPDWFSGKACTSISVMFKRNITTLQIMINIFIKYSILPFTKNKNVTAKRYEVRQLMIKSR